MLRNTFFAVLTVLAAAGSSQAAIMVDVSPGTDLPMGDLTSYTLSARGTAGEVINTFSGIKILGANGGLGVHNVSQAIIPAPGNQTPTRQEHTPGLFNADWAPYDTFFMFNGTETLSAGTAFNEANNGATTGQLGLTPAGGGPPPSGYGEYNWSDTSSKVVLAPNADADVPFMQVVMRKQDAARLTAVIEGNAGQARADIDMMIGGGGGIDPPIIDNVNLGDTTAAIINHTFVPAATSGPITSWSIAPTTGSPVEAATISPTGVFQWHTIGSARSPEGVPYSWTITATGPDGSDTGVLSLELVVPEPATMSLVGLAMVGLVGFARRRS